MPMRLQFILYPLLSAIKNDQSAHANLSIDLFCSFQIHIQNDQTVISMLTLCILLSMCALEIFISFVHNNLPTQFAIGVYLKDQASKEVN